jgi:hypothetical protein
MNSVHKLHSYSAFDEPNHYIVTLHDSTFECVARSFETVVEQVDWTKRHEMALQLLRRVPASDIAGFIRTDPLSRLYKRLPAMFRFVIDVFRT